MRLGNFGDCQNVGESVYELRIHFDPGFRIYFMHMGRKVVLLLSGGGKGSQQKDITQEIQYAKEYQNASKKL